MLQSLLTDLRCPACWTTLAADVHEGTERIALEATLTCNGCRRVYHVREGAAYLAVLDDAWATILKELVNRREIIEDDLRATRRADDRSATQDATVATLAQICFDEAARRLPTSRPLRLIDCGAGMFETSAAFADMGIDVVATETEISMVRYANFQDEGRGDPQPFDINGRRYHIRDPHGHPRYFSRVVSDIQRLPFASGTFDIAFCRAMLHHVDRPSAAVCEMARLVRPGGLVILCAEPARSLLDREADYHEETADREEGMNEQVPTLLAYRRPLVPLSRDVSVQYWPFAQAHRTRRVLDKLPYRYEKHLWPGEEIRGWKWMKLLPIACGVNVYARRNGSPVDPPLPLPIEEPDPITAVADVYMRFDNEKSIEALAAGTEELKALRRDLVARQPHNYPASIEPGAIQGMLLESGWGPIETVGGRKCRRAGRRTSVFLTPPAGTQALEVEALGNGNALIRVNGVILGTVDLDGAWKVLRLPLPRPTGGVPAQIEIAAGARAMIARVGFA